MKKQRSVTLDDFDLKILRLVQVDNQMPQRTIGDKVGLSPLRSRGGFNTFARIRSSGRTSQSWTKSLVERPLTIIVHITTENERLDLHRRHEGSIPEMPSSSTVLLRNWGNGFCPDHECEGHGRIHAAHPGIVFRRGQRPEFPDLRVHGERQNGWPSSIIVRSTLPTI